MNDPDKTISSPDSPPSPVVEAGVSEPPRQIGRYRIQKVLGKGGFGLVYLAHDDQLQRLVAIKVPHPHLVAQADQAAAYLTEARTVANLDHPHIVPVFDVGSSEAFPCFVVSKYIDGIDLSKRLKQSRLTIQEVVQLLEIVAEALHYAHKHGLVHRDIKPGNLLLDQSGKPFVADFGLALREQDVGKGPRFAGTPAYMSPEQARGEGHRVDGRSDIFSLGVVFYELLVGRRPFKEGSQQELLDQITSVEVRPPRQYDDHIPKELERICLKALSKRASERYPTAKDLADDLRHFLTESPSAVKSTVTGQQQTGTKVTTPAADATPVPASDSPAIKIVPKGLRSFDAHDADFFLELVPGPRDRGGLPDSLRFWKTRIEEPDADHTFSVGLIYGPSGCGKSSLVKAGLLPRLSSNVIAVYVEATAEETETRLLNGLRKRCSTVPENLELTLTLAALRQGQGIPLGRKVLIVIDQFEQWLHANRDEENSALVQALRQCDGGRLQCVVMVRDDFWMAATRFMRELEMRLLEGQNSAAVDLFPIRHAEKVLAAFGRAFSVIPEHSSEMRNEQKVFLRQAVTGLSQEGKVISVRLALFAEMMKSKTWSPATLKEAGGTEGVGVTFLEETFSSATAPPEHRLHQKAARSVLKALLPESGTDIKGHMRSHAELLKASGYRNNPKDFDDLIRILDSEIRLITPTDPEGVEVEDDSRFRPDVGQKYYQLTHDYLVPSLREWLNRKQKETRRGRAELLLADRAGVWNSRPENRQLPSLWQWLQIRWWTSKPSWTLPQQKMMRRAARYQLVRVTALIFVLSVVMVIGLAIRNQSIEREKSNYAAALVGRVFDANISQTPGIIQELGAYRTWADPLLKKEQAASVKDPRKQLHASLALLPVDSGQVSYLYERMLKAEPQELVVIRDALIDHKSDLIKQLWTLLENTTYDQEQRFRAACALSVFAPNDARWNKINGDVADLLVIQKPFVISQWASALKGVGRWLIPPLAAILADERRSLAERSLVASLYGDYATGVPNAYSNLELLLTETIGGEASMQARIELARKQAGIGLSLMIMGHRERIWQLLKHSSDPALRSYLIEWLGPAGVDPKVLIAQLNAEKDVSVRRAILMSLGGFGRDRLPVDQRSNLLPRLLVLYRDDPDPGIHGAVEFLIRQWQAPNELKAIDKVLATGKVEGGRQWYINRQGQTMIVVSPTGENWMGEGSERIQTRIDREFAIASKEVTADQFLQFRKEVAHDKKFALTGDCPVNSVSWYDAAEYCNWLSEKEGIPRDEWCYLPNKEGNFAEGMTLAPHYVNRNGYRLPTEAEWEYACRAGAVTAYSFGGQEELLGKHGWFNVNSLSMSHPVASLKPNDTGLFDMHGNLGEWCNDWYGDRLPGGTDPIGPAGGSSRVYRGGSWNDDASFSRSGHRSWDSPYYRGYSIGFRVAAVPSR